MKKSIFLLLINLFALSFCFGQQPTFIANDLDAYINKGLKDWNLPGLAIAVVKDGKIIVMKGYGVRNVKTNEPVDENTLFMIASNTKLFTATALAQLEADKKISAFVLSIRELFRGQLFLPTGGVDQTRGNLSEWFNAGVAAVGMGGKLISKTILECRLYDQLYSDTVRVLETIKSVR